jgi:hypothetical protein
MSDIPPASDINVFDSLDERSAVDHFLGKDLSQAEALFRDNFIYYQDDLMWMGPRAFCYYVQAAIAYLTSPCSDGDSDAASSFCTVVEFRVDTDRNLIEPVVPTLRDAIRSLMTDLPRFAMDASAYGDVESRYKVLLSKLAVRSGA